MTDIEKIGRNESCLCGSGKKYKRCCLSTANTQELLDFTWRKLRKTEGSVVDSHLMRYMKDKLPKEIIGEAIVDFYPNELPQEMDEDILFNNFFMPWLLFNWIPDDDFDIPLERYDAELTIAENYLNNYKDRLSPIEKRFIETIIKTHYSYYSVLDVVLEKSITVKDVLLGTTHLIKECEGTRQLKRGDIIFSRILTLDEQSIFIGMAPFIIPSGYHTNIIDFKKWLIKENSDEALTVTVLRNPLEFELIDCFFKIINELFNKPMPTLLNTDDELFQFSKSQFKVSITPEEAAKKLMPLTLSKKLDDFLDDVEYDKSGQIVKIKLPWLKRGNKKQKNWDNTVMGHITIKTGKLILETNSEERTKKGKAVLNKHLGDNIHFQQTLIETPEQKMKSVPEQRESNNMPTELLESPEFQKQIQEMARSHWENWFNEPIPALDDKTPREAAKTAEGKERLEALLLHYERSDANHSSIYPLHFKMHSLAFENYH
jgi:hypothetical protein